MISASSSGLGHKKQANVISDDFEEEMWAEGLLGSSQPKHLLDTMTFLLGYSFGLRAKTLFIIKSA